jgi:hypothetical protein
MQTDSRIKLVALTNADSNAIESGAGSAALDALRTATQAAHFAPGRQCAAP